MRSKETIIKKLKELEDLNMKLAKKGVPFYEREPIISQIMALKWVIGELEADEVW